MAVWPHCHRDGLDRLIPEKRRDQLEASLIEGQILVTVRTLLGARAETAQRLLEGNNAKQMAVLRAADSAPSR